MRIRTIALLLLAWIGVVTLSGVTALYQQQRSRLVQLDEARSLVEVVGHLSRFVEAMALERGVYNQLLVSTETGPADVEALAGPRVSMTDGVFRNTEAALAELPSELSEPIDAFVQNAKSEVRAGRSEFEIGVAR